jgi:Zn-dependent M16 (insulinase) family peptidase
MLGYYPDRVLPSKTMILPVNTSIYLSLYNESCSKFLTKKTSYNVAIALVAYGVPLKHTVCIVER